MNVVYLLAFYTGTTHVFFSGGALISQFLKNARITKQTDNCSRPLIRGCYMAETFVRLDFKLFLIIWPVAVLNNAVLKFADAPNVQIQDGPSYQLLL